MICNLSYETFGLPEPGSRVLEVSCYPEDIAVLLCLHDNLGQPVGFCAGGTSGSSAISLMGLSLLKSSLDG